MLQNKDWEVGEVSESHLHLFHEDDKNMKDTDYKHDSKKMLPVSLWTQSDQTQR